MKLTQKLCHFLLILSNFRPFLLILSHFIDFLKLFYLSFGKIPDNVATIKYGIVKAWQEARQLNTGYLHYILFILKKTNITKPKLTDYDLGPLIKNIYIQTFNPRNIVNGFSSMGL